MAESAHAARGPTLATLVCKMSQQMNNSEGDQLVAGKSFPWEYIAGFYLRLTTFTPLAEIDGDTVRSGLMGAYGLANVELPEPQHLEAAYRGQHAEPKGAEGRIA